MRVPDRLLLNRDIDKYCRFIWRNSSAANYNRSESYLLFLCGFAVEGPLQCSLTAFGPVSHCSFSLFHIHYMFSPFMFKR